MVNPPSTIITCPVEYIEITFSKRCHYFSNIFQARPIVCCTHKPSSISLSYFSFTPACHICTNYSGLYFKNRNIKFAQPYRKQLCAHTNTGFRNAIFSAIHRRYCCRNGRNIDDASCKLLDHFSFVRSSSSQPFA